MSLKALKQISQRNKDLVFGYCRENENQHNHRVYPLAVMSLCSLYTNAVDEQFQENNKLDKAVIEIKPYEIIGRAAEDSAFTNVYGINQAEKGIHIWNIRINKVGESNAIGVVSEEEIEHAFNLNDGLFSGLQSYYMKSMDVECDDEAEAQLTLDCHNWTLMLDVNEKKYQLKLKEGKYRFRIFIFTYKDCSFKLLKYSHIV